MKCSKVIAAALLGAALAGTAIAQAEPTIDQVYQAAKAGRSAEADRMIDQVLQNHPNSAKAHFVKAELAARQSDATVARRELAAAERLAPGLPFAKPQAVAALRGEVAAVRGASAAAPTMDAPAAAIAAEAPRRQVPMAWIAVLFAAAAAAFYFFVGRRPAASPGGMGSAQGPAPATEIQPAAYGAGYPAPAYPASAYPAGAYPQPAQPGMASTLGRGLATGLAVGAGALAAQEIGRRMFEHHPQASPPSGVLTESERGMLDPGVNADMGGNDFGIDDAGSWDSGGGIDVAGSDWDT